jgi:hypothetical protein
MDCSSRMMFGTLGSLGTGQLCIVELPREFAKGRQLHNCLGNCTIAELPETYYILPVRHYVRLESDTEVGRGWGGWEGLEGPRRAYKGLEGPKRAKKGNFSISVA